MSKCVWDCPACGFKEITSKFCPDCGAKKPEVPAVWDCPTCVYKRITSKFCPECGTKKPLHNNEPASNTVKENATVSNTVGVGNINNYLNRGFMFLEDGKWENANEYLEKALDIDCQCAEAYLGKLLVDLKVTTRRDLENVKIWFGKNENYLKAIRFGNATLQNELTNYLELNNAVFEEKYNKAISNKELDDIPSLKKAIEQFEHMNGYKNSNLLIEFCRQRILELEEKADRSERIRCAEKEGVKKARRTRVIRILIIVCVIALLWGGFEIYNKHLLNLRTALRHNTISANYDYTVGIKSDGTVVAVGYETQMGRVNRAWINRVNSGGWTDIIDISSGIFLNIGLKEDGTVVIDSYRGEKDCGWRDIVDVSAGTNHVVGVKSDGTVVAVGDNDSGQCDVMEWTDIVAVSAGAYHTVGLEADGTVVAVGLVISFDNLNEWKNIISVSAGDFHTVGLKADGTVVATGCDGYDGVGIWDDIVAISAGGNHTVGLKADGTVVAVGNNDEGQCNVQGWTDIVAISAGGDHTVGIKSDGTVVAVGSNDEGECNVSHWTNIKTTNNK